MQPHQLTILYQRSRSFTLSTLLVLGTLLYSYRGTTYTFVPVYWQSKVEARVLEAAASGGTEFLVLLSKQADLQEATALPSKEAKGAFVYRTLVETAQRTQRPIISALEEMGAVYRRYWIVNLIWVQGDLRLVQTLAQKPEVAYIYANPAIRLEEPVGQIAALSAPAGVEWNIALVGAPQIWAAGFNGQETVIGGQDTGYDWTHPAIINQYRGWDGTNAHHDYNWHDAVHDSQDNPCGNDSPFPCDDFGHGTHTMGSMVGDDGAGNQIGMAPGARWIGCRNMDQGWGTPQRYIECYQWFVAPWPYGGDPFQDGDPTKAPDVINNSWACLIEEGCTDPEILLSVVQNVRAAGIVTVQSAGNSGRNCGTINTPAAIYAESFTVGATDSNDTIASFSSRGPVTVDGSGRRKPDISAPGVAIRSCLSGGGFGVLSGTSMAAPHVAGLVALLISAAPSLRGQVEEIETLIERSALPRFTTEGCGGDGPTDVPNHVYGWGRIDALAALTYVELTVHKTVSSAVTRPGETLTYTLTVSHALGISPTTQITITDVLPEGVNFLTASEPYTLTEDRISWHFFSLNPDESLQVTLVVQVAQTASGPIVNDQYWAYSAQARLTRGTPIYTWIFPTYFLPLISK